MTHAAVLSRAALYVSALAFVCLSHRIGEVVTALVLAAVLALALWVLPTRDEVTRRAAVFTTLIAGAAFVLMEQLCIFRGVWAYMSHARDPAVLAYPAAFRRLLLMDSWNRGAFPGAVARGYRVPMWLLPAWGIAIVAVIDVWGSSVGH